jgi:hypothetical protein
MFTSECYTIGRTKYYIEWNQSLTQNFRLNTYFPLCFKGTLLVAGYKVKEYWQRVTFKRLGETFFWVQFWSWKIVSDVTATFVANVSHRLWSTIKGFDNERELPARVVLSSYQITHLSLHFTSPNTTTTAPFIFFFLFALHPNFPSFWKSTLEY